MITWELPELELREMTLNCVDGHRGDGDSPVPPLSGRISLGGPEVLPITPDMLAADPPLRDRFQVDSARHDFLRVHLVVSFAASPRFPPLVWTRLRMTLTSVDNRDPVVLAMDPKRLDESDERQKTVKFSPQLSGLGIDFMLGERTTVRTERSRETFLVAHSPLQSTPEWTFMRTKRSPLLGSYDLVMIVRTGKGAATSLSCELEARTKGGMLRLFRDRELARPLTRSSVL